MLVLLTRRFLAAIAILVLVSGATFFMLRLAPGDPGVIAAGGPDAPPEAVAAARERLGLNDPLLVQYLHFISRAVKGDLGNSFFTGQSVMAMILDRLPVTVSLAVGALAFALLISIPAGTFSALSAGSRLDRSILLGTTMGISLPNFFIGGVLILALALKLQWLPATGYVPIGEGLLDWMRFLILPWIALGVAVAAELARHLRGSMRDVLTREYLNTARAKGLSGWSVVVKHAMRNASLPVVTVLGIQIGRLLGGTVIIEQIFNLNGLGALAVQSVYTRDLPVVIGVATVTAVFVIVTNVVVDISYGFLNPKLRAS